MSPSMATAPEGDYSPADYSPAGAMSGVENSTDHHPRCWPRTVYHFFSKLERLFFTCGNSKFISESCLAVCMNKALLTDVIQSYGKA